MRKGDSSDVLALTPQCNADNGGSSTERGGAEVGHGVKHDRQKGGPTQRPSGGGPKTAGAR
eukprot:11216438-Lingulodinium_polyedra.AAC.1